MRVVSDMARMVPDPAASTRFNSIDPPRPVAGAVDSGVTADQRRLRVVVSDVIRRTGSQKAAAVDMQIDPGQLARQLQTGHLTVERLEALGPAFCAEFGRALIEQYGVELETPDARIHRLARQLRAVADEIDQAAELLR